MAQGAWNRIIERKLFQLLTHLNGDPLRLLTKANVKGFRNLPEQNPVAMYLRSKIHMVVDAGPSPGSDTLFSWVTAPGPNRDVIAACQLPQAVADFLTDFNHGLYPLLEYGRTPMVVTPWGTNVGVYEIDQSGLWWVRGRDDEGLVASQWCLFASSQAARACGQVAGTWRCWGREAWPIAAAEVPEALLPAVLHHAPIHQDYSQGTDRMMATYLNSCSLGREYMKAVGHGWLWPADALISFEPIGPGGVVACLTCSGRRATITQTSLVRCVKDRLWPVTLADCEVVGDDSGSGQGSDEEWMKRVG